MDEETQIGPLLSQHNETLASAESCTGGLVGHLVTNVSGSSYYFLGGVIAYSNAIKQHVLGVRPETLSVHGAVSEQTAVEMARGVRRLLGADYGLSTTGIAGPTGATPGKPVGLVFIALVGPSVERCERHVWDGDRVANKVYSARRALQMLIEQLADANQTTASKRQSQGVK
jgi:nicotinamide-nucleotide amidase